MRSTSWVLLVVLLAVSSCGKDHLINPRPPGVGSKVVFVSIKPDYVSHLYVANVDGTGLTKLTTDSAGVIEPQWSPDGGKILFLRWYGPKHDSLSVTVINADGTNPIRLTHDRADVYPGWSPDGTRIVYQRNPDDPNRRSLQIMNADGSGDHTVYIADSLNGEYGVTAISWATNDYLIGTGGVGLYRLRVDGSGIERIGPSFINYYGDPNPQASPDGGTIAFVYKPYGSLMNVYTIKWDGTDLKQLTTNGVYGFPAWSRDGKKIGYVGDYSELWSMNADGSNKTKMPVSSAEPEGPTGWDWK